MNISFLDHTPLHSLSSSIFNKVFFPVQIQRVYSAASVKGVKWGTWATFVGPWIVQLGFIFMGIMGVSMLGESLKFVWCIVAILVITLINMNLQVNRVRLVKILTHA